MSMNEMESKIRELRQLQALIDEATAEAEAIKDTIKAEMGDAEELRVGEYKVTWKAVTSSRLDTTALKKALPDVAERFDAVSVSLNAPTAQEYAAVCPSPWGEDAFFAMLDFAKKIRKLVRDTQLTVVDYIGEEPVQRAKELAARLDIPLRVRQYQE